jgi:hypothetical protein
MTFSMILYILVPTPERGNERMTFSMILYIIVPTPERGNEKVAHPGAKGTVPFLLTQKSGQSLKRAVDEFAVAHVPGHEFYLEHRAFGRQAQAEVDFVAVP